LVGKSSVQINWITYAVALYLSKDYKRAIEVLRSFEKTTTDDKNSEKLRKKDKSELTLLEARIYEAMGNFQKAIECLNQTKAPVVNEVAKNEQLARLHLALGDKDKAIFYYE
jgi:tetratricopeptide (TPR) repeat protein